ncbi:TIGR04338 family metallohydrolase [Nakamurella leprariae]|uniref:TIGR04338 family metallohydrolase n=1 Tax=Nakamurella leprariae TaxID=2803911 RepID=A0A938YIN2_9ACTN|nr:TIGR04338 family metallohydrolase [Nakamurella leprariae]MBM9468485.1 TIGR04338 family metallohydrolase [Nakamurella leprariae]
MTPSGRATGRRRDGPERDGPERDGQRSLVYDAEQLVRGAFDRAVDGRSAATVQVAGSTVTLPVERRFASVESVQAYLAAVTALPWIRARWPRAVEPVTVRARAGAGRAHYERAGAVLAVPVGRDADGRPWALRELVVLHELAHHLAADDQLRLAPHGPAFVGRFLDLVDGVIGPEAAFLLRVTLLQLGAQVG